MRSAWPPTRSMSFETVFDVSPNCLLALPTLLATDFTSTDGLPIERGTEIPRTVLRLIRLRSTSPPATPTAVAPTASAGPLALSATCLIVPTTPLLLWLALLLLALLLLALLRLALPLLALLRRRRSGR